MSKSRSVGTVLNINSKKVGALKSIGGIELSADTVDVSDLGNSTGYREFLQGFKDAGEIALSGFTTAKMKDRLRSIRFWKAAKLLPAP